MGVLTQEVITWLEGRGISAETAARYGLSGSKTEYGGDCLVTPYYRDGNEVNRKNRFFSLSDPDVKRFSMVDGGELCLWNVDILNDSHLYVSEHPLVITEGEMDALACIEAGHDWVVSVPNGSQEATSFLEKDMDRLKRVDKFIIAADADEAGQNMKQGLLNALSMPRCHLVSYPDGCKDMNEVLVKAGPEAVRRVIAEARAVPFLGAYYANDFGEWYGNQTFDLGLSSLDATAKLFSGGFAVVTGTPGTGKSQFVQAICYLLAKKHGLKAVIGSFENPPAQVIHEFTRMYCGAREMSETRKAAAAKWISDHFFFVVVDAPEAGGKEPEETDLGWFLDAASTFVIREGAKVVVIDPWNELEHYRRRDETGSEYIARMIREMKRWARRFGVILIVVGHPTKLEYDKTKKTFRKPNLYDIYGSSAWFDKADIGVVLSRTGRAFEVEVDVQKVRFKDTGSPGTPRLEWNEHLARYESVELL